MTNKQLQKQIDEIKAQLLDMQAVLGVLIPVFEREYKKGGWDFSKE